MVEETILKEVLLNRLKRLEGQVRGVEKMIEDGLTVRVLLLNWGQCARQLKVLGRFCSEII